MKQSHSEDGFNHVTAKHSAAYAMMEGYCAAAGLTFVTVWTSDLPDIRETMKSPAELDRWVQARNEDRFSPVMGHPKMIPYPMRA